MPVPNFLFQTFRVGKPCTPYSDAISLFFSSLASTATRAMPWLLSVVAAFLNSGARFLQCPHQGA
jgi:hypothetical protein